MDAGRFDPVNGCMISVADRRNMTYVRQVQQEANTNLYRSRISGQSMILPYRSLKRSAWLNVQQGWLIRHAKKEPGQMTSEDCVIRIP